MCLSVLNRTESNRAGRPTHPYPPTHTHTPRPHSQQDEFGVRARREGKEWLMTRLPARVFRDASPKGALFTVGGFTWFWGRLVGGVLWWWVGVGVWI